MQNVMEKSSGTLREKVFADLSETIPEVLYSMTLEDDGSMTYLSNAAEELTGCTLAELCAQSAWMDVIHPDDKSRYSQMIAQCKESHEKLKLEYRIIHRDGSCYDVFDRGVPVLNESGDVVGINGLVVNVTAQKQARRELEKSQMLQSIGKLSAGIAHEINTPIQFLGDNMRFLDDSFKQMSELTRIYAKLRDSVSRDAPDNEIVAEISTKEEEIEIDFLIDEIPQAIEQSLDGIKLVSKIVSAMRDFSHIDDRQMAAADLNKALSSTITILRNELKYVADIEKDLDENLPEIVCCIDDMHQVFLNLLINAAHSIEEVIDTGSVQRGVITVKTYVQGEDVVISISDTGMGISPEIREKIFEPFFTTKKKDGKGTGQGLAMVLSIVHDKHNGKIELESEVGVGTTFTIRLPIDSDNKREE